MHAHARTTLLHTYVRAGLTWQGQWEGLQCRYQWNLPDDVPRVVTNLHLPKRGLTGPMPRALPLLANLTEIDFVSYILAARRVVGRLTPCGSRYRKPHSSSSGNNKNNNPHLDALPSHIRYTARLGPNLRVCPASALAPPVCLGPEPAGGFSSRRVGRLPAGPA